MLNALSNSRRTHYSDELFSATGAVTVMGWVVAVRGHGNISFLTLKDKNGAIQIVCKKDSCSADLFEKLSTLKVHTSVGIVGTVVKSPKAPNGIELVPQDVLIFSESKKIPPFEPFAQDIKNIDTRLEVRSIDLRRNVLLDIFNIRSLVLKNIRNYFYDQQFIETNTPKIISSATEGGSALFSIFYYNKPAFLAQSPQLYKEQLVMSFEKVFEIAPIFRAEASRTNRHLSEAISIDLEEAYVDYNDIMVRVEGIIRTSADAVNLYLKTNSESKIAPVVIPDIIPRYSYTELIDKIRASGKTLEFGDDLYPSLLQKIGLEGFYFIKDWPLGPKPFYVKSSDSDENISESFDLMYGDLELSSGSSRIFDSDELKQRMTNKGLKTESFQYHLSAFDFGVPPHAGCGIGLERLLMALTNTTNIRDVTLYPRDVDRLTP